MFCSQWMIVPTVFKSLQVKGGSFYRYTTLPSKATHPHNTQPFRHRKEEVYIYGKGVYLWMCRVCTHGRGVYLWNGCIPMEGVCTFGKGVYLWKGCVPMEGVWPIDVHLWKGCGLSICTYGRGVYLWKHVHLVYLCNGCLYGRDVYLWKDWMFT